MAKDLCPDCEASSSPNLPQLFHCPNCDEDHVAIGLEKYQIEYLHDLLSQQVDQADYWEKKGIDDKEYLDYMKGERKMSMHILRDVIKPGLDELNGSEAIKKISIAEKRKWK